MEVGFYHAGGTCQQLQKGPLASVGGDNAESLAWLAGIMKLRLEENPWPQSGVRSWLTDMPPLPESHSPDGGHWTNSVAVCAIMKDENITDVVEWLAYYKCALVLLMSADSEHVACVSARRQFNKAPTEIQELGDVL